MIRKNKSVNNNYAFIDSQNLNMGTQKFGWKIDWRKFRKFLADEYGVTKAYMFIGHMAEHEDLYVQMHDLGYLVVLKPTQDMTRPQVVEAEDTPEKEKRPIKGNVDADLVLWVTKEMPNYNRAVIVSGDGDFFSLYEYLIEKNKLQNIMVPNWQYSQLLNSFDRFIVKMDKLRGKLEYRTKRTGKQNVDK